MNFKDKLSGRIQMNDIHHITYLTQGNELRKQELYNLIYEQDDKLAYQAAWVLTHFSIQENEWLYNKQDELIDEVLVCKHPGKRRLILSLLFKQPIKTPPRTDFLDFCMERMLSKQELPGVQSLCMKLAYEMCRPFPELVMELRSILDIMEPHLLPTSMKTVRKNILKKIGK